MLRTKLEDFVQKTYPSDLLIWLSQNPHLIYHTQDALMSKMRRLELENGSGYHADTIDIDGCKSLLNALFYKKESVSEVEFNLLEAVSFSLLVKSGKPISSDILSENPLLSLLTLMMQPYDMINTSINDDFIKSSAKYIYTDIMNIYIPYEDTNKFIDTFDQAFPFKELVGNASNTNWFIKKYEEANLSNQFPQKDMLLLFKFISDIYTNKEQKLEYFFRLHRYYNHSYAYNEMFNSIADRYEKYFKDDTRYLICELLDLASSDSLTDDVDAFLMTWSKQYSVRANQSIMKCFLTDIKTLIHFIPTYSSTSVSNLTKMNDIIPKLWGMDKYNVEGHSYENEILLDEDKPISFIESLNQEVATEALHKDSVKMNKAGRNIYKAYRAYKDAEEKVDSQISKAVSGMKKILVGDVRTEIIEGRSFSAIGLLKKYLGTVAIFSFGPIKGVITLVIKYALKKKTTTSERRKIIMELETEIELITEKIEDARGDGNREAKYAMMRTKKELEHALTRIKYGMEADQKSLSGAKDMLNSVKSGDYV